MKDKLKTILIGIVAALFLAFAAWYEFKKFMFFMHH
jgi:hypothetical protein